MLIAGEVGSGKTTLLQALLAALPSEQRIVTIEDPIEIDLTGKPCLRADDVPSLGAVRRAIAEAVNLLMQLERVPAVCGRAALYPPGGDGDRRVGRAGASRSGGAHLPADAARRAARRLGANGITVQADDSTCLQLLMAPTV